MINLSGENPSRDPKIISTTFSELPLLGPTNEWPQPSGIASTLIDWEGLGRWRLLRVGSLIPAELEK